MKLAVFCLLLVGSYALPAAEVEKDNKAVESKTVKSVTPSKEAEKSSKQEKRAPVVQTVIPGELKYGNKIEYSPKIEYSQVPHQLVQTQEVKYVSPDPKSPYYEPPQPAPKPQYIFYSQSASSSAPAMAYPSHMQAHLVLMLAVPHPSGQYMMLYPAQNFLLPMFYRPHVSHQPSAASSVAAPSYQPVPASAYQTVSYQPAYSAPALAQHAGFVAQHQLAYGGPYRSEKYAPGKQM